MKKCNSIFFFLFSILLTCCAFAQGTTNLTTTYPAPTAAYNQVKLATNYVAPSTTAAVYCTGVNNGAMFMNFATGTLYQCTAVVGGANAYCTGNNGAVIADSTGALHVCTNGQDTIYPQECINLFCSYQGAINTCPNAFGKRIISVPSQGACPSGFQQMPLDNTLCSQSDVFSTSGNTTVLSIACCSGANNGSTCVPS